jgi:hypothetical protein
MADETRHSRALEAQIISDPDELARKESFNVVEQFRAVADMVETFLQPDRPFKRRLSHLHRVHDIRNGCQSVFSLRRRKPKGFPWC